MAVSNRRHYPRKNKEGSLQVSLIHNNNEGPEDDGDLFSAKMVNQSDNGFYIDIERFGESHEEGVDRLRSNMSGWFFTVSAKKMATEKLSKREDEKAANHGVD